MKRMQGLQNELYEMLDLLESEVLYGVLPLASHPHFLRFIRDASAWFSHRQQRLEQTQIQVTHQCLIAHQRDLVRTQILVDEIKELMRTMKEVHASSHIDDDVSLL